MSPSGSPALLRNACITRSYHLEGPVERLVAQGALVDAHQILLQTTRPSHDLVAVPLCQQLHASPRIARSALIVRQGQHVAAGELLAERTSWFVTRHVTSPVDAYVGHYHRGTLYLRKNSGPLVITSHLPGSIRSITNAGNVTVETRATLVAGAWRKGTASGPVTLAETLTSGRLVPSDIGLAQTGRIVVGKYLDDLAVIRRARLFQVAGIVAGSMPSELVPQASSLDVPIMLTVGLGNHEMSAPVLEAIGELTGMPSFICAAQPYGPHGLVIPSEQEKPASSIELQLDLHPGVLVRVVRGPYHGQLATVITLGKRRLSRQNSTIVPGAEVRLATGKVMFLPEANLQAMYRRNNTG